MRTMIVGLVGGPGSGKSTLASGVFADLKEAGVLAEFAPEFAKELCWGGSKEIECQPYVWGVQSLRVERLVGQVEVVITDSPPVLSVVYGDAGEHFRKAVWERHAELAARVDMRLVFVERVKPYEPAGRYQDEAGAATLDHTLRQAIPCPTSVTGDSAGRARLVAMILTEIRR